LSETVAGFERNRGVFWGNRCGPYIRRRAPDVDMPPVGEDVFTSSFENPQSLAQQVARAFCRRKRLRASPTESLRCLPLNPSGSFFFENGACVSGPHDAVYPLSKMPHTSRTNPLRPSQTTEAGLSAFGARSETQSRSQSRFVKAMLGHNSAVMTRSKHATVGLTRLRSSESHNSRLRTQDSGSRSRDAGHMP
jgi:hypothetical protein